MPGGKEERKNQQRYDKLKEKDRKKRIQGSPANSRSWCSKGELDPAKCKIRLGEGEQQPTRHGNSQPEGREERRYHGARRTFRAHHTAPPYLPLSLPRPRETGFHWGCNPEIRPTHQFPSPAISRWSTEKANCLEDTITTQDNDAAGFGCKLLTVRGGVIGRNDGARACCSPLQDCQTSTSPMDAVSDSEENHWTALPGDTNAGDTGCTRALGLQQSGLAQSSKDLE